MKVTEEKIWWEFKCKGCGSTCQAEPNDVTSRPGQPDCDGDVLNYICVVECGKCGKPHNVPQRKLTERIEIAATKRRRD